MSHADITERHAPAVKDSTAAYAFMTKATGTRFLPPPTLPDKAAWLALVDGGGIRDIANSEVLVAFDYWVCRDRVLTMELRRRLAAETARILRWRIGRHLPNEGRDIIVDAAGVIGRAIDAPTSKPGLSIRKNFWWFVFWRTLDALERSEKANAKVETLEEYFEDSTTDERPSTAEDVAISRLDAYRLIRSLEPPKDRAAFLRFAGDSYAEIARKMKVASHNTIRAWLQPIEHLVGY